MSALTLAQTLTAISPGITSSFLGTGGTGPLVYSVLPNGAGGSVDSSSGVYTPPSQVGSTPQTLYDTVRVTDSLGAHTQNKILVGNALILFCDVLDHWFELGLGRIYVWDQKIFQPTDSGLYIAVSVPICKPFGNSIKPDPITGWADAIQSTNFQATLDINIISRSSAARDRKEEILLALNSIYSQQQQEANSFYIANLPTLGGFKNLSQIDGAAIPYRYQISVNIQYSITKINSVPYFGTFNPPTVSTNP